MNTNDTKSGLTQKVIESTNTLEKVEKELVEYVQKFTKKGMAVLAGNSIHMDRAFMMREMPKVLDHLHYRIIDVSSFYELGRRHNNELISKCPKKKNSHTARDDILESIAQLKWYRDNYMIGKLEPAKQQKVE
jgi:oligoribonuclease